jgi:hypothetical protein
VATKAVVEAKLEKAVNERAQIAELIKQGKTLQQIEVAVGDPPPAAAAGPGGGMGGPGGPGGPGGGPGGGQGARGPMFAPFSEVVYKELTQPAQ